MLPPVFEDEQLVDVAEEVWRNETRAPPRNNNSHLSAARRFKGLTGNKFTGFDGTEYTCAYIPASHTPPDATPSYGHNFFSRKVCYAIYTFFLR